MNADAGEDRLVTAIRDAVDRIELQGQGPEIAQIRQRGNSRRRQRRGATWAGVTTLAVAVGTVVVTLLPFSVWSEEPDRVSNILDARSAMPSQPPGGPPTKTTEISQTEQAQLYMQQVTDDVIAHAGSDSGFSGVVVDPLANEIRVYRVPGINDPYGQSYEDVVDGRARLVVAEALLTEQQTDVLLELVNSSVEDLRRTGIVLTSWGPSPNGGPFRIGTQDPESDYTILIERFGIFGEDTVAIDTGDVAVPLIFN